MKKSIIIITVISILLMSVGVAYAKDAVIKDNMGMDRLSVTGVVKEDINSFGENEYLVRPGEKITVLSEIGFLQIGYFSESNPEEEIILSYDQYDRNANMEPEVYYAKTDMEDFENYCDLGRSAVPAGSTFTLNNPGYYHIYGAIFDETAAQGAEVPVLDEFFKNVIVSADNAEHFEKEKYKPIAVTSKNQYVDFNNWPVTLEAYNIYDNNYFKLRDIAYWMSEAVGGPKRFEVTWDESKNAINLITDKDYTVVGGECKESDGTAADAVLSNSQVYLNGQPIELTAYTINGNNYFKLRDLCEALDMMIEWDEKEQTIYLYCDWPYGHVFED